MRRHKANNKKGDVTGRQHEMFKICGIYKGFRIVLFRPKSRPLNNFSTQNLKFNEKWFSRKLMELPTVGWRTLRTYQNVCFCWGKHRFVEIQMSCVQRVPKLPNGDYRQVQPLETEPICAFKNRLEWPNIMVSLLGFVEFNEKLYFLW